VDTGAFSEEKLEKRSALVPKLCRCASGQYRKLTVTRFGKTPIRFQHSHDANFLVLKAETSASRGLPPPLLGGLFERVKELQTIVHALVAPSGTDSVLATLVTAEGSSYRRPGARLLVTADGQRIGSISGGCLEEDVLTRAQRVARTGEAEAVVYDTTSENDLVWGVGLGCHGVVRVLIEKLPPQPAWAKALAANFASREATDLVVVHDGGSRARFGTRLASALATDGGEKVFRQTVAPPVALFVYGAGDDAQPLVRLAKELGWHVTVADVRPAFATATRFPTVDRLVVAPPDELVTRTAPGADALVVAMTHHYVHDVPLLRALLPRPVAYLGLLGPRKRADRILADLAKEGVSVDMGARSRLHAPVGLDLGADAPEQVALAIVAEMQAALTRRDARPLRERSHPIHA
jgi:xanthine dehydrogenase accessory factor